LKEKKQKFKSIKRLLCRTCLAQQIGQNHGLLLLLLLSRTLAYPSAKIRKCPSLVRGPSMFCPLSSEAVLLTKENEQNPTDASSLLPFLMQKS
jgi:hypothetical protein